MVELYNRGWLLVLVITALMVSFATPSFAKKDDLMDIIAPSVIGSGIGERLGAALKAAHGMRQATGQANQDIQMARQQFWAEYPSGPNKAQAEAEFSRLLEAKDLHYLLLATMNWMDEKKQKKIGTGEILQSIGGQLDKGIPPSARTTFQRWVDAVMENFEREAQSGEDWMNLMLTLMPTAIEAAPRQYQAYKFERDWAEFDAAGRVPEWVKTPHGGAIYIIYRFGKESPERAEEIYREMVEVFGEEHVHQAAGKVIKAGISSHGTVQDLGSLGLVKYNHCQHADGARMECEQPVPPGFVWAGVYVPTVFNTVLGMGDLRHFIMSLYFRREESSAQRYEKIYWGWKAAESYYRGLLNTYGEKLVFDIAARLQKAPKRMEDGELKNPIAFGNGSSRETFYVLKDLLAQQNPQGYVRQILSGRFLHETYRRCYLTSWYVEQKKLSIEQVKNVSLSEMEKVVMNPVVHTNKWKLKNSQIQDDCSQQINALGSPESVLNNQYEIAKGKYGEEALLKAGRTIVAFFEYPEFRSSTCQISNDMRVYVEPLILEEILNPDLQVAASGTDGVFESAAYRAWAKFAPGANVVMLVRGLMQKDEDYTITLDSVTADRISSTRAPVADPTRKTHVPIDRWTSLQWISSYARSPFNSNFSYILPFNEYKQSQPIRTQLLTIDGRQVETKVFLWGRNMQLWTSDQIPGGIARVIWDEGKSEIAVKSFSGLPAEVPPLTVGKTAFKEDLGRITCKAVGK